MQDIIPNDRPRDYADAASIADDILDEKLRAIRNRDDLTPSEAATLRCEALEHHLEVIEGLRAEYFGRGDE